MVALSSLRLLECIGLIFWPMITTCSHGTGGCTLDTTVTGRASQCVCRSYSSCSIAISPLHVSSYTHTFNAMCVFGQKNLPPCLHPTFFHVQLSFFLQKANLPPFLHSVRYFWRRSNIQTTEPPRDRWHVAVPGPTAGGVPGQARTALRSGAWAIGVTGKQQWFFNRWHVNF